MRLKGHTVVENVERDLVGYQTVTGMKEHIQYVRTESAGGLGEGLMALTQV